MFTGLEIEELVTLLERRGVSLFHACQYADFRAYLQLGGIPSRALLEQKLQPFTTFETDAHDRQNGVWDKVFVNLADFGEWFARGFCAVPNVYGPIALQLQPAALHEATDVAVCRRSAGAANFNREREALGRIEEVDELFLDPPDAGFPQSTYVKPITQSQPYRLGAKAPEVSCTVAKGFLSLENVVVVWTDPYVIGKRPLREWVRESMCRAGMSFRLCNRFSDSNRRALYSELLDEVAKGCSSLRHIIDNRFASLALRTWAADIWARKLEYQFQRYATYLTDGTIRPLVK